MGNKQTYKYYQCKVQTFSAVQAGLYFLPILQLFQKQGNNYAEMGKEKKIF